MKSLAGKADQSSQGQECLFAAEEFMDDGSNISLSIKINKSDVRLNVKCIAHQNCAEAQIWPRF